MPTNGAGTASSSVSPKVIVPSVTVISLLVLITLVGAVIIFVRAYRKRRRGQSNTEKQDEEARLAAAEPGGRSQGQCGSIPKNARPSKEQGIFGRPGDTISSLPHAAKRQPRAVPSQGTREAVDQGFHRGRNGKDEIERVVVPGQGYNVRHAHESGGAGTREGARIFSVPIIGKIERITGNPLSNDFYSERASGSGHSRSSSVLLANDPRVHSYPVPTTGKLPQRSSSLRPATFKHDTNISPISPGTDISTAYDISLNNEHSNIFNPLSPTPAAPAAIALKYPNLPAPTRANAPVESQSMRSSHRSNRSSSRLSYTQSPGGTDLAEHISSQYSRVKERRQTPDLAVKRADPPEHISNPPLSAAFGGFNNPRRHSNDPRISSGSTDISISTEPLVKGHAHRASWSGRSVLELDPDPVPLAPSKRPPPPPLISTTRLQPHPLRRENRNLPVESKAPPKPTAAPRARTSAFGSYRHKHFPLLPPIPPDPENVASGADKLIVPTHMSRSGSNSKLSVLSVPSTISSFNTITGRDTGGLSPAPARRSLRNTPDQLEDTPSNRRSVDTSTTITEAGEASNMAAAEPEVGMRVREGIQRASDGRRTSRKNEDRQGSLGVAESGKSGAGHHFLLY